jgi:uncharacterized protein (UPF0303 family)
MKSIQEIHKLQFKLESELVYAFPNGSRDMSLANDIEILKQQEAALQFKRLNEDDAWTLGNQMRGAAIAKSLPFVIDIRIGIRPLFYTALIGSTPENPDWVRRKVNTVYRFESSSYRVGREYQLRGANFDASRGLDPLQYAPAGGGFPIRLAGSLVGVVTVSGIPQRDDHNFVAENLAEFLGVAYSSIQLPPESD